jgi:hypothetical protein
METTHITAVTLKVTFKMYLVMLHGVTFQGSYAVWMPPQESGARGRSGTFFLNLRWGGNELGCFGCRVVFSDGGVEGSSRGGGFT